MKPQYQHELMTSFMLWFDHELLQEGEAYTNQTGQLYIHNDSRLPDSFKVYASSYKQWVNDSSISGGVNPIIPTTFNGSGRASSNTDENVTSFDVGGVDNALDGYLGGSYGTFNGTYQKREFLNNNNPVYTLSTNTDHRFIKPASNKWSLKDTDANRIVWEESVSNSSEFPWNVTSWTRKNNYGATSSAPNFSNLVYSTNGADDFIFDFENGRIIETGGAFSSNEIITGTFAVKDFNIYLTNETEEDLILENKFQINSRYGGSPSTGIEPYDQVVPAIFINTEFMTNEGFAFGGEEKTTNIIKAVVLAEDSYQLDGVLSIFADSARKIIPKIPFSQHPGTEYGDIKNGYYNYVQLSNSYLTANPYYIDNVTVSKFSQRVQNKIPGDLKIGFIDFELSTHRFPRS